MTERKELLEFIKLKYPVGSMIWDSTCSQPYKIHKRSVFEINVWTYDDYNDDMRPSDETHYTVEFYVKNPGKYSSVHHLKSYPKKWVLKTKSPTIFI